MLLLKKKKGVHWCTLFSMVCHRFCERFCPITLCRTFLCSVSSSHSDNNQSVTLSGRWGCFRVDCFSACIRRRGVLSDLWGTLISNRTAILNVPINPWGWRRGWLLETHRLNKTPWWDRRLINKPPCTPCGRREQKKGGEERALPQECLIWFLSIYMGHLTSHSFNSHWLVLLSLFCPTLFSPEQPDDKMRPRERVSSNIPAPLQFRLLVALFFLSFSFFSLAEIVGLKK